MDEYSRQLEPFKDAPCKRRMWVVYQEARTPLSTIRGYTATLKQIDITKTQGLPENFPEILNRIDEAERKLSTLMHMIAIPRVENDI